MMKPVNRSTKCAMLLACLCGMVGSFAHGAAVELTDLSRGGGCTHDIECDDGLPCTTDYCDFPTSGPIGTGVCQHSPVPDGQAGGVGGPDCALQFGLLCGGCDDGLFCNGAETCQSGACAPGAPPCTGGQVCSESFNMCQDLPCSSAADCANASIVGAEFAADAAKECNGRESCVSGVCVAGQNPCGPGAICSEKQCSQGAGVDFCITDEDCAGGLGTCSLLGPVCKAGQCCRTSGGIYPGTPGEPTCERRLKDGTCAGGTHKGAACTPATQSIDCPGSTCPAAGGSGYNQSCDALGGIFNGGDYGTIPNGKVVCPVINGIEIRCPKYSSGIAPSGPVAGFVAASNSAVVHPAVGAPINKLGDDYRLSNYGVCVGGTRNGIGCGSDADCPSGGICNLSGQSVMSVNFLRIFGGLFPDTRAVVEFRDTAGRLVIESYEEHEHLNGLDRFFFDPPIIVPSQGFVVLRVASEYSPNGGFVWASTDAVDVGFNDPNVLWVNDGPLANFLAPNPGILIFELEGEKVAAPLGACCDSAGASCTDGVLPWVCEGNGNHFQGAGTTCPVPACDTGACCSTSGACTTDSESDCTTAGGDFQGYGTDCDPDCCPQPLITYTGADRCEDVTVLVLSVPSIVTVTGDNSTATLQSQETPCYSGTETPPVELGWFEAFEFLSADCAMIRVDYCCTNPVKRPAYPVLFDECPCSAPIQSIANPYQFPQTDHDRGSPYCDDDNQWATFGPLPPGTYYIPVQSGMPGSFGPYQLHITAEACPTAACCVSDQCMDGVNQLQCDALGGTFLGPPQRAPLVPDCSTSPCATGSCCSGPGECFDNTLGQPVDKADCDAQNGTYHGGMRCQGGTCQASPVESCARDIDCPGSDNCIGTAQQIFAPSPCPLCSIEGSDNCQPFDNALNFTLSDRHVGSSGILAADDIQPEGDTLTSICVWGFYFDSDPDAPVPDCAPAVSSDHFRVRIYNNNGGSPVTGRTPGTMFGESAATSEKGIVPSPLIHPGLGVEVYGYQLVLTTPITGLTVGQIYWLEISNDVSDSQASCNWYLVQRGPFSNSSNPYSYVGTENGYEPSHEAPFENAFCTNFNIAPSTLGALPGACCTCEGVCSLETFADCANANGVWDVTRQSCSGVNCPVVTVNDACTNAVPISPGSYVVDNQCASTDGYGPIPSDVGSSQIEFDVWYTFIASQSCDLVVSGCQTGMHLDAMLAVYHNPDNPTVCPPCPYDSATSAATLAGVGQDESCTGGMVGGAGYWRASEQILRNALPDECFLVRVGGYPGNRGTAILDISCEDVIVDSGPVLPQSNAVCTGAGIPYPCCSGTGVGTCNKSRFISFTPPSYPGATALRVKLTSLHHVFPPYTGGASIPFTAFEGQSLFVGPPVAYQESTANPTPFRASTLQCTPYYQNWSTVGLLHVTGPATVPSSIYHVEYLAPSCMGVEGSAACQSGGANVSAQAELRTTRWGDIETPYNPPNATAQPDVGDIAALVSKFRSAPGAPTKARALLAGVDQFGNVNMAVDFDFSHIAACVDAFRGKPYPYTVQACP